jgi:hypothetical protein
MRALLLTALVLLAPGAHASPAAAEQVRQERSTGLDFSNNFTLLFGLNQPLLLRGFNFAFTYTYGRLIFESSLGVGLDYPRFLHNAEERGQDIRGLASPWTWGPGVGYRFTDWLDVRLEPKANRYEVTLNTGERLAYTSFSLGAGAYFRWYPFSRFVVEPSVRYWPRVASTLENDRYAYQDASGVERVHTAHSPNLVLNVSLGYTFGAR